jgi:transposase-like protein
MIAALRSLRPRPLPPTNHVCPIAQTLLRRRRRPAGLGFFRSAESTPKIVAMSKRSSSGAAKWRAIIQDHQASGLPVAQFCRQRGVGQPSFFAWRRRLRHAGIPRASSAFIEARVHGGAGDVSAVAAPTSTSPIELLLPRGHRLLLRSGFDPQVLRDLLRELEQLA